MRPPQRSLVLGSVLLALAAAAPAAHAFCGFYVARADTSLYNRASRVVIARDGERTVMTMANDYRGELSEFAVVVPVPTFVTREQIHVAEPALIDHLDAYTAPRLVEYHDPDPCMTGFERNGALRAPVAEAGQARSLDISSARSLGVTVEASYTVGEYDIQILSATSSDGLDSWLRQEGYRLPPGAAPVLGSYLKQGMRFFVARVNLGERSKLGFSYLRPLQVAYESPKFMLPIRLGTLNADGEQELFVFVLGRRGRVETTNYRTVRLPSDVEVPVIVRDDFTDFYRDMFATAVEREAGRAVFLEYAWDMGWCDPCAADPLSPAELGELGVFWIGEAADAVRGPAPQDVFVTRLHVTYDAERFAEDLRFQETGDRTNFQGRYVMRHAFRGEARCGAAESYRRQLAERWAREASTLASLTGWDIDTIRERMRSNGQWGAAEPIEPQPWWRRLWRD